MTLSIVFSLVALSTPAAGAAQEALLESLFTRVQDLEVLEPTFAPLVQDEIAPPSRRRRPRDTVSDDGRNDGDTGIDAVSLRAAGGQATPQGRNLGIGLQLGYPTALTLKYMLRPDQGLVAGIGGLSGFAYDQGAFSLHVDYVYHPHVLTSGELFALTWYVGAGGNLVIFANPRQRPFLPDLRYFYFPTTMWLAARVPIGVNLAFSRVPFEIYLEAVPSFLVFPGLSFGLGAAVGGRFYF